MAELVLHFITEADSDVDATVSELQEYLSGLAATNDVSVEKEQPRLGAAEILTILSLAAKVPEIVTQIADFVRAHRKRVKDVEVEIDGHRVPIDKLTDDQKARLRALLDR